MENHKNFLQEILIDENRLQSRIAELGTAISNDYKDSKDLLLICILRGAIIFLADLSRQITIPHAMDFMAISSYGSGTRSSSGVVRINMDLTTNISGKDVLIVEDIIDSFQLENRKVCIFVHCLINLNGERLISRFGIQDLKFPTSLYLGMGLIWTRFIGICLLLV